MVAAGKHASSKVLVDPLDTRLLAGMHCRALLAIAAFATVCGTVGYSLLYAMKALAAQYEYSSLAMLLLAIGLEGGFALVWLGKYRRLNQQPSPRHAPLQLDFDPMATLNKFIEEQKVISKWICIKQMLSAWFNAPFEDIWQDNVADLVTYGFFYMSRHEYEQKYGHDARQLVRKLEQAWGLSIKPGRNPNLTFMAHLWQPVRCGYRPLAFYLGIEVLFMLKHCVMLAMGFTCNKVRNFTYYAYLPKPPVGPTHACGGERDLPVLFQHGVGLGLLPYVHFVARIAATGHPVAAMECSHLGMRWVSHIPDAEEVVAALVELLQDHLGWKEVCASGHSYGTFYCSRLRQSHPQLVTAMGLVDPVTFNMFTGKLIERFVYQPHSSSLITWLIARDIHHATSVCRRFYWSQLNLWPDQLTPRTLVVLSDSDDLVPVQETMAMLRHQAPHAVVLHHPTHAHADFIMDLTWQNRVVTSMVEMLNTEAPAQDHCNRPREPITHVTHMGSGNSNDSSGTGLDSLTQSSKDTETDPAEAGMAQRGQDQLAGHARPASGAVPRITGCAAAKQKAIAGEPSEHDDSGPVVRSHQHSDSACSYEGMRLRAKPHRITAQ